MGPARLPGCLQTDRRTDRQTDRDAWPVGVVFVCVWIRSLASRVFVCVSVCFECIRVRGVREGGVCGCPSADMQLAEDKRLTEAEAERET